MIIIVMQFLFDCCLKSLNYPLLQRRRKTPNILYETDLLYLFFQPQFPAQSLHGLEYAIPFFFNIVPAPPPPPFFFLSLSCNTLSFLAPSILFR